jgi:hypothetical protein
MVGLAHTRCRDTGARASGAGCSRSPRPRDGARAIGTWRRSPGRSTSAGRQRRMGLSSALSDTSSHRRQIPTARPRSPAQEAGIARAVQCSARDVRQARTGQADVMPREGHFPLCRKRLDRYPRYQFFLPAQSLASICCFSRSFDRHRLRMQRVLRRPFR